MYFENRRSTAAVLHCAGMARVTGTERKSVLGGIFEPTHRQNPREYVRVAIDDKPIKTENYSLSAVWVRLPLP